MTAYYLIGALFLVGLYGVIGVRNMIRKVIALTIANAAVILLFVYGASEAGDAPPILEGDAGIPVDPLPHALMLTAIVVGVATVGVALALLMRVYKAFGTIDEPDLWKELQK